MKIAKTGVLQLCYDLEIVVDECESCPGPI